MELKYYLRGLGLGIVVTAIIMSLTTSKTRPMTDAEIISRAKQLGMTEERTLKDTESNAEGEPQGEPFTDEGADEEDAADDASPDSDPDQGETGDGTGDEASDGDIVGSDDTDADASVIAAAPEEGAADNTPQDSGEEEAAGGMNRAEAETEQTADDRETGNDTAQETLVRSNAPMVITIGSGDGSYAVSRKLADVGAVSSAENFDTFLCQNGYDKKIRTGTYTIPANASNEQMARIITGAE
ncbi:MAG: hypothetical protein NC434_02470 [Ruminococcus sp.]|nr:hypothetical protein [Ruminococcus sp.]